MEFKAVPHQIRFRKDFPEMQNLASLLTLHDASSFEQTWMIDGTVFHCPAGSNLLALL